MERVCSKCGSNGPFHRRQSLCKRCQNEASIAWQKAHPEAHRAKVKRFNKRYPGRAAEIAARNYQKRKASGKIDAWKQDNREQVNRVAREGYARRKNKQ